MIEEVRYTPRRRKIARGKAKVGKRDTSPKKKFSVAKADKFFADKIKDRDGKCLFPGCTETRRDKLTCSHYHSRGKWGTRFDEKNCITLCRNHHYWDKVIGWEFQKQVKGERDCDWDGRYTVYMKQWLGEEEFQAMKQRAAITGKRKAIIDGVLAEMNPLENLR